MINTIIAAFVALFFWGKSTHDVDEKTQLASITRTIVYLVLSVIVGVFFYKSYQVATVFTFLQVGGLRESRDTLGNLADTIDYIKIENKFATSSIISPDEKKWKKDNLNRSEREAGGVYYKISVQKKQPYLIKTNPMFSDADIAKLKLPISNLGHLYEVITVNTAIPSFFPFLPDFKLDTPPYFDDGGYVKAEFGNIKNFDRFFMSIQHKDLDRKDTYSQTEDNPYKNGFYSDCIYASDFDKIGGDEPYYNFRGFLRSNIINALSFFTAADISQYIHIVQINTDCHIGSVEFTYDIPIDIDAIDSCMTVGTLGFSLNGKFPDKNIKNNTAAFLVKLPTLANMQLIRSLILTTLITAIISLFLTNFFYVIRKNAIKYKEKHIKNIDESKIKLFIRKMYVILYIFIGVLLYYAWIIYHDNPICVYYKLDNYGDYIALGVLVVIIIFIYVQFKKCYYTKKKK